MACGQFCRHFLAPLTLLSYADIKLNKLLSVYIDGIPLEITVKLLPFKARFNIRLYLHLFLHNKLILRNQNQKSKIRKTSFTIKDLFNQVDSLMDTIKNLTINTQQTEWISYYEKDVLGGYLKHKESITTNFLNLIKSNFLLDLVANDGTFSIIASKTCKQIFAFDIDPLVIEKFYLQITRNEIYNIIPPIIDIANPESAIG